MATGLSYCHGMNIIHHDLKVSLLIQQSQLNLLISAGQYIPDGRIQRDQTGRFWPWQIT